MKTTTERGPAVFAVTSIGGQTLTGSLKRPSQRARYVTAVFGLAADALLESSGERASACHGRLEVTGTDRRQHSHDLPGGAALNQARERASARCPVA